MRLAYVTSYDARNVNKWSGTGYHISQSLKDQSIVLDHIGPLKENLTSKLSCKYKRHYHDFLHKKYLKDPEPSILRSYAAQVRKKVDRDKADLIFSATTNPIAYLDSDKPVVFWADATFAGMLGFYPHYDNLCDETIRDGHQMEQFALERSQLAIYASDWAAQTAIGHYNADPKKVKVVPFGANLERELTLSEIKDLVDSRPTDRCKLLFLGVDWIRKGGNVALEVAKTLHRSGLNTELTIVGSNPISAEPLPDFVKPLGFISKSTSEGREKINRLIAESHFLIMPSTAECYGIVLCEANSFGVPCLATNVGGIPTIIRNGVNGQLFQKKADIAEYCSYVTNLFSNYSEYKRLAISAFHEYQSRLNWSFAGQTVRRLLMNIID